MTVVAFVVVSTTSASQNLDHVIAVATRYIEQHLGDGQLSWDDVKRHLQTGGHADRATEAITRAVLDLERADVMVFSPQDKMRRPRPGDAAPAPLRRRRAGWNASGPKPSSTPPYNGPCQQRGNPGT